MFRMKLTLTTVAVAAAIGAPAAVVHAATPVDRAAGGFVTDTLAPGGDTAQAGGVRFVTDTLAPGGSAPLDTYRFTADTLAPGGGASSVVSATPARGFDWADAGIGAAGASGLAVLLLIGGRALVRRHAIATA